MIILANPIYFSTPQCFNQNPSMTRLNSQSPVMSSAITITNEHKRRCEFYDLHNARVPYKDAWSWQKSIVEDRKALNQRNEDFADTLIVLQHQPVYTLGSFSSEKYLHFDLKNAPFDVYRTERGGEVTYHGPGQLVMYPILNLRYHKMDLHWYLRALEEVVIRVLSSTFSIKASRIEGLTGVWVGDKKLAAVGVKVSQWVTYHGLALNVNTNLTPFCQITPCGIQDRQVGTVMGLLEESRTRNVHNTDSKGCELIDITYISLIKEFSEVFQVDLQHKSLPARVSRHVRVSNTRNLDPVAFD